MSSLVISVTVLIVSVGALARLFRGPIFVPARQEAVLAMVELLKPKLGERTIDLGSGDGRIVIAMARSGAEAHGFEHNPILFWLSRQKVRKEGLSGKAFIHYGNFWEEDFSKYDVITIFGIGRIMKKLEGKLEREARPGTRVASYLFRLPNWREKDNNRGVHLYVKESRGRLGQKPPFTNNPKVYT